MVEGYGEMSFLEREHSGFLREVQYEIKGVLSLSDLNGTARDLFQD